MINRKYEIEGLDNVVLTLSCTLDQITFVVVEKTKNYRSIPVYSKEYTYERDKFNFEDAVIEVMHGYFEKKAIEEEVADQVPDSKSVIEIPSLEIEKN